MKNAEVSLNFLEITPKEFGVTFYWQYIDEIAEEDGRELYKRFLSINNAAETSERVAIVFEPTEGFHQKVVGQDYDIELSKRYLLFLLNQQVKPEDLFFSRHNKYQRLYFKINTHAEGIETVWIEPYFLSKSGCFGVLFDYKFFVDEEYQKTISGAVNKKILQLSGTLDATGHSNRDSYIFKCEKIKIFLDRYYPLFKKFGSNPVFCVLKEFTRLSTFLLGVKTYQFKDENEHKSPYFGLKTHSPLQKPPQKTNYIFLFRKNDRSLAIELVKGLKGESYPQQFCGIEKLFKLPFNKSNIHSRVVEELNDDALNRLAEKIYESSEVYLPIILTNSRQTQEDHQLYYKIKHIFTSKGIACQVVTKDLINNPYTLKYSLSNIALQIFAKSGGQPWKIKPSINKCLIVGIGSKNKTVYVRSNGHSIKKIEKYFTYSVLTDSSGIFKEIQILSEDENEESYYSKLIKNLTCIICDAHEKGYNDIVVHTPFKISKDRVWSDVFQKVPKEVMVSIVIINGRNKYFGYDFTKNSLVPYESTCIAISGNEYLVWFEGLQFNNSALNKSIGGPVYLNFWHSNKPDEFRDCQYRNDLLQDCINLSGANWRGFKAKQLPVSIYYCQKISEFLVNFEEYDLPDIKINNLKPWFL